MTDPFQYTLTPEQVLDAVKRNSARLVERMHTRWVARGAGLVFIVSLGMIAAWTAAAWFSGQPTDSLLGGAAVVALVGYLLMTSATRQGIFLLFRRGSYIAGPRQLAIEGKGLWIKSPHGESFTRWSGWQAVEEYRELALIYHDEIHFEAVPFSAFESEEERGAFISHVRSQIGEHEAMAGPAMTLGFSAAAPTVEANRGKTLSAGSTFRSLLRSGLEIAFFRRVPEDALAASWLQIAGLIAITLVAPLAYALITVRGEGYWAWRDLPGVLYHVPVMLVAAIALAYLIGRRGSAPVVLVAGLLAWTVIDFLSLAAWYVVRSSLPTDGVVSSAFYYGPVAWLALAVARFAISLVPAPSPRRAWVLIACALLLALPLAGVYRQRSLWSQDYSRTGEEGRADMMAAASEEAFYRQPELLQRELSALKPGRKGHIDLYFVGVAGYGHQDVFMREVDSVAALFRERFDADGHIVKLINNPKTVLSTPLASVTSLKAALKRASEVMDIEEDVLVLFLTSHGSSSHEFSLELWPYTFKKITPETLRSVLDESGIKNRVVIVSACYAGGFIRDLESENTLVITAAAPHKNSFGCSNENDWTYFGKAYFDEALRKTYSFTQAFDLAKPLIEQREREHKFEPSEPQISLGSAIKEKLAALELQREHPASAAPTTTRAKTGSP